MSTFIKTVVNLFVNKQGWVVVTLNKGDDEGRFFTTDGKRHLAIQINFLQQIIHSLVQQGDLDPRVLEGILEDYNTF